ncbi:hypothetical protein [Lysinibacillus fusiformis]|uniref:hypothetical protein n=1 Tax=Lysinibacillus fusiformis TaxID=28031 RepID=UPI0021BEF214|nr:hypothetical protein [Lysinibacillus fusiformis]UXJ71383.1 hypothetical protein N5069_23460 [Lysinibacillus fusiformis]
MRFALFVIFGFIFITIVVDFYSQEPKIIKGSIQEKVYKEKKCRQELTYDPALNMLLPKENCKGPRWAITINNEEFQVSELLYNKLEVESFYTFSYHPLKGISLINE